MYHVETSCCCYRSLAQLNKVDLISLILSCYIIFMSDKTLCDACNLWVNEIKTTFRSKTPKAFNDFLAFINSEGGGA